MSMRRFMLVAMFVTMSAISAHGLGGAEPIAWNTDLEAAFREAHATNRPLLLHFWTPDCVPCRRLEQNVFNKPRVAETMRDFFVPVKINANEHPELASRYRISSVPKDVIVTPNNEELHRLFTPQDPDQYVAQLSAIAFKTGATAEPEQGREEKLAQADETRPGASGHSLAAPAGATASNEPTEVINRYAKNTHDTDAPANRGRESIADATPAEKQPSTSTRKRSRWEDAANEATGESVAATESAVDSPPEASTPTDRDTPPRADVTAKSTPPRTAPRNSAPLGLDGYCPVTLVKHEKWVKGDSKFGVVHRGRVYLFASEEEKSQFWSDPDAFSPVLAGIDPVQLTETGEAIDGLREHGVVYRNRVYLFSSEESLERFWQEPERFASPIRQAMETGDVGRLFR